MSIVVVEARTLGQGWLAVSRAILEEGAPATYDGQPTREVALLTLVVAQPAPDDEVIGRLGDPDWLAWMHDNFFVEKDVPELGDAKSYAVRLFNYAGAGRDQIAWVVERLRAEPESRSATITTFQPLTDTSYIPCVSLLDFWLRDGALELVVYAHSLDFGKKAYGNLVELARLQDHVAGELGVARGRLVVHAKSAHIYEPEWALMASIAERGPAATLR
jgi:thymidylate synthase